MSDPKEVVEMRESLTSFARLARKAVRTAKESQRNLRLVISSPAEEPDDVHQVRADSHPDDAH